MWVLDYVGYDARGGCAEVFSTFELAKEAGGGGEWVEDDGEWVRAGTGRYDTTSAIYPVVLDARVTPHPPEDE